MLLVLLYALLAAVIALVSGMLPGTSIFLTFYEVGMMAHLAHRRGVRIEQVVGGGQAVVYLLCAVVRIVVSMSTTVLPVVGWFVAKPLIAFGSVMIWGWLADGYFRRAAARATIAPN